ncbi:MAG: hypothetical protein O2875_05555 [Planctomycetota bacterium]|nr:hypothetical protein [Planctomycetota bacterium]MDA1261853.1 hypothetical protein [Planctomycetota bacterium]
MNQFNPRQRLWLAPTLFWIYTLSYAAFVVAAAFFTFENGDPVGGLAQPAFAGLSFGVVAGFALIFGAFVLAMIYALLGPREQETPSRSNR